MVLNVSIRGMGDAVYTCWIAQGRINAGLPVALNAGRNAGVCELFGIPQSDETGIDLCSAECEPWRTEMRIGGGTIPRPQAWADIIGAGVKIARPEAVIPDRYVAEGESLWGDDRGRPRVLLFPRAAWPTRIWPLTHWIRLAWMLEEAGCHTLAMDSSDKAIKRFPRWAAEYPVSTIAATMMRSDLVIGNESGPAHLAGTLGVPVLGIIGALDPAVIWGHMPSITPIRSKIVKCVGCHFQQSRGFSIACDAGCTALFQLPAEEVLEEARRLVCSAEPSHR